jgi:DNA-binding NtrC family response regulator
LENLVKRYVIVGNEQQIIRELATQKPIVSAVDSPSAAGTVPVYSLGMNMPAELSVPKDERNSGTVGQEMPSLIEIGRRAAMQAEREAIERVLAQTRWNRRQAARILRVSYKALLNKLKAIEENKKIHSE